MWSIVLSAVGGVLLLWVGLIGIVAWLAHRQGESITLVGTLRLLPDILRLVRRLAVDSTLPRSVRVWVVVLLAYLLLPIDLIPDFIPVIGVADDAIIIVVVLGYVIRRAGRQTIDRHWPGTEQGLAALHSLLGIPHPSKLAASTEQN